MKKKRSISLIPFCLIVLFSTNGCSTNAKQEDMYSLAANLTKATAAVQAKVKYEGYPEQLADRELLTFATKHDPKLSEPFLDYKVKISTENSEAIMLICNKSGEYALLEDAGCTPQIDIHHWQQEEPKAQCSFTISAPKKCSY
ncbi:hypothetical protein [Kangiella shandongensis]|uniref:hypothetical protein n=1 Tax=Kangiella shandongensis TaxID=2763258 RepID=UPI001CBBCFD0|nr:hypothetical protein [Kangiella shandongensis]